MRLIQAFQKLDQSNETALQTRDAAGILEIQTSHASKILERLAQVGLMVPLRKGLWAFPKRMDTLLLPRYLSAPYDSYVSLQTALYYHNMIEQIPSIVYAVTLGRTKRHKTLIGEVSLHHIDVPFFFGYNVDSKTGIAIATPEKALLDFFYLSTAKSHLFGTLPELELPKNFSAKNAMAMIGMIPEIRRRSLVQSRFEGIVKR